MSVDLQLLKEFDEFLKENYSDNPNTRKSIISAIHTLLETNADPDDLPISTRSKSVYRRAKRLWDDFLAYKKANASAVFQEVRRAGALTENSLRKRLRRVINSERDYRMMVLKAINSGRIYVNYLDKNIKLIYID